MTTQTVTGAAGPLQLAAEATRRARRAAPNPSCAMTGVINALAIAATAYLGLFLVWCIC